MRKALCLALTVATLTFAQDIPVNSKIPLTLNFIENLAQNSTTKELEIVDTTLIPHYNYYDSTYKQRVYLATHSHSEVVTELSYYTESGKWLEDRHRATPPGSTHESQTTFYRDDNTLHYIKASSSGSGSGTVKKAEETVTFYNNEGLIDSVDYKFKQMETSGALEITQKNIYHYDETNPNRLLKIEGQRDDTLYEETYTYSDTSNLTKITVEKTYSFEDSLWYAKKHPVVKYCRDLDTTIIEYKSENGDINSHTIRKYNDDGILREETNLHIITGEIHAKKTYTYTAEGYLEQKRLYRPNNDGDLELTEENNYDYSWNGMAIINTEINVSQSIGFFSFKQNKLSVTLPEMYINGALTVVDATGREFIKQNVNKGVATVSLQDLATGVYIATFRHNGQILNSFRFVR